MGPLLKEALHLQVRENYSTDEFAYPLQNMPYSVYILLNKSRTRTYTGVAVDVEERLKRHNDGQVPASRHYRPYEIIYIEPYLTLKEARQRERFYKSTTGRRKIREIISRLLTE